MVKKKGLLNRDMCNIFAAELKVQAIGDGSRFNSEIKKKAWGNKRYKRDIMQTKL